MTAATPVMFLGIPANPETGSERFEISAAELSGLTWNGDRPDWMALLVGLQHL
jgi:hypothetical protein